MATEIKIQVPKSLDDISLRDYLSWLNISEEISAETREKIALQTFCKIPASLSDKINASQRNDLLTRIATALDEQPTFYPTFKFNGIDYGFEPNLEDMSFGQFVDIDSIKDYREDLPKLLSILYRPITKRIAHTYEIEPYKASEAYAMYLSWPASVGLGALLFFWTIGKDCLNDTLNYTPLEAELSKRTETSEKSGDGTATFTASRKAIFADLKILNSYLTTASCFGLPMKQTLPLHISKQHPNLTHPNECIITFQI